jgi:hypothetical protein
MTPQQRAAKTETIVRGSGVIGKGGDPVSMANISAELFTLSFFIAKHRGKARIAPLNEAVAGDDQPNWSVLKRELGKILHFRIREEMACSSSMHAAPIAGNCGAAGLRSAILCSAL